MDVSFYSTWCETFENRKKMQNLGKLLNALKLNDS